MEELDLATSGAIASECDWWSAQAFACTRRSTSGVLRSLSFATRSRMRTRTCLQTWKNGKAIGRELPPSVMRDTCVALAVGAAGDKAVFATANASPIAESTTSPFGPRRHWCTLSLFDARNHALDAVALATIEFTVGGINANDLSIASDGDTVLLMVQHQYPDTTGYLDSFSVFSYRGSDRSLDVIPPIFSQQKHAAAAIDPGPRQLLISRGSGRVETYELGTGQVNDVFSLGEDIVLSPTSIKAHRQSPSLLLVAYRTQKEGLHDRSECLTVLDRRTGDVAQRFRGPTDARWLDDLSIGTGGHTLALCASASHDVFAVKKCVGAKNYGHLVVFDDRKGTILKNVLSYGFSEPRLQLVETQDSLHAVYCASCVENQDDHGDQLFLVRTGVERLAIESALGDQLFEWPKSLPYSRLEKRELLAADSFALGWQKWYEKPNEMHPTVRGKIYDFLGSAPKNA